MWGGVYIARPGTLGTLGTNHNNSRVYRDLRLFPVSAETGNRVETTGNTSGSEQCGRAAGRSDGRLEGGNKQRGARERRWRWQ
jgi:hypothetical protein